MNTNKNTYTFIYASIVVIIVAFLLAFVSSALRQRQQDNIALDKKKHILASLNIFEKDAASAFDKYITSEQLLNNDGTVASEEKNCAFECGTSDIATKRPLYIAEVNGEKKYIFPLSGQGLWGPISGYIALNSDKNTVYGVDFSHDSETPGLGAEITNRDKFQKPFQGKAVMKDGEVALSVVKNGNVKNPTFEVDGLSGATFTSVGVSKMIQGVLSNYAAFLGSSCEKNCEGKACCEAHAEEHESNN
ncbi:MAG: NADH:ubiquinone reductase (Na(+)-transporting) subunit C [Bacteroidaceae bacterium]|nr:NADH:ubiquinone reductase (Na(+)-transporting) subunit C [Bacteroidaceae bacterium]